MKPAEAPNDAREELPVPGRPADAPRDTVEIWGRRVGKILGWAFAAFLLIQLIRTYAG